VLHVFRICASLSALSSEKNASAKIGIALTVRIRSVCIVP
jgi:hypothetical protein